MAKKIVLFSDGTGNSSAKAQKTNVWRLFQALDQTKADQIAKYDDGVGTSRNKYLAAIGGAFGWGLKRNVLDLYKFVCRNFETGDKIYGFGFSRGAFTIRLLVDFVDTEGLVTFRSEEELSRNAAAAYRHYRSVQFPSRSPLVILMRWLRDAVLWLKDSVKGYRKYTEITKGTVSAGRTGIEITFLGLWDTVEAYGMPIPELKRGIDLVLWPMTFGDLKLSPRVRRACHALSLDDQRTTFHPLPWDEVDEAAKVAKGDVDPGRITQVWFAGVHSNVGGGYPEDQLSLVSLDWMIGEAVENGLVFNEQAVEQVLAPKSPYARLYDSRAGMASYYRYAPREIRVKKDQKRNVILPIVHGSVVMRMAYGSDHYAPISLPHEFWVLAPDGELLPMEGVAGSLKIDTTKTLIKGVRPLTKTSQTIIADKAQLVEVMEGLARPDRQSVRLIWDTVFWRRFNYFVTVALTAILVAYPLSGDLITKASKWYLTLQLPWKPQSAITASGMEQANIVARGPISSIVDSLSAFIPTYASPWITALKESPLIFSIIAGLIFLSLIVSKILDARIHDRAWLGWHKTHRQDYIEWLKEAEKGQRIGLLLLLGVAVICLVLANVEVLEWSEPVRREIGYFVWFLIILLVLGFLVKRPVSGPEHATAQGSIGLSVARSIRNNRTLLWIYKCTFERAVPILFALILVAAGFVVANRALFDIVSASGYFCESTANADAPNSEKLGRSAGFSTDRVCWPSGLVLTEGRRYRIRLTTEGDWFDRTIRADVAGFPGNVAATLLKRWWRENWFTPIVRIGPIGNDEYVLKPVDELEKYDYSECSTIDRTTNGSGIRAKISKDVAQKLIGCAPTPNERRVVVADIKARMTGELFLFVNDAVLMWPRYTNLFYGNNSGMGTIEVEHAPQSSR